MKTAAERMKPEIDAVMNQMDRINDVFEHFNATPKFIIDVKENPYGGNPTLKVTFWYEAKYYAGKQVVFIYRPTVETIDSFVNSILAYMFECVDTFVNI